MKKTEEMPKLRLSKDTIRQLVPAELQQVGGGVRISCGPASACDCSGPHPTNQPTLIQW